MEENFRRLEKENDQLRSLIADEQKKITTMQDALNEQSKARSLLETENEKAKIEKESCQLMRDTLRYVKQIELFCQMHNALLAELKLHQKICNWTNCKNKLQIYRHVLANSKIVIEYLNNLNNKHRLKK